MPTTTTATPGNINQLLFALEPYVATLGKTHGVMGEFVNPKYADAARTVFKKPTRLECMMQNYPQVYIGCFVFGGRYFRWWWWYPGVFFLILIWPVFPVSAVAVAAVVVIPPHASHR